MLGKLIHFLKIIFIRLGILILSLILLSSSCSNQKKATKIVLEDTNNSFINLSIDLLSQVKSNLNTSVAQNELAELNEDSLAKYLATDNQKKAFWINIYNAHIQILLKSNPELFNNRGNFFSNKRINIAGRELSFDDIEHGIIRSSKFKLALGLVTNPFASEFEKTFRTSKTDGRVHFALNCGAKSCPLIAIYSAKNFDQKINKVARSFLNQVCKYNQQENIVYVTSLFSWFRGDFGEKNGTIIFLKEYEIIPKDSKPTISYNTYDWTLSLGNYYE